MAINANEIKTTIPRTKIKGWNCHRCCYFVETDVMENRLHISQCPICYTPRPLNWKCPDCDNINNTKEFGFSHRCMKCNRENNEIDSVKVMRDIHTFRWNCPNMKCNYENLPLDNKCAKCSLDHIYIQPSLTAEDQKTIFELKFEEIIHIHHNKNHLNTNIPNIPANYILGSSTNRTDFIDFKSSLIDHDDNDQKMRIESNPISLDSEDQYYLNNLSKRLNECLTTNVSISNVQLQSQIRSHDILQVYAHEVKHQREPDEGDYYYELKWDERSKFVNDEPIVISKNNNTCEDDKESDNDFICRIFENILFTFEQKNMIPLINYTSNSFEHLKLFVSLTENVNLGQYHQSTFKKKELLFFMLISDPSRCIINRSLSNKNTILSLPLPLLSNKSENEEKNNHQSNNNKNIHTDNINEKSKKDGHTKNKTSRNNHDSEELYFA